MIQPHEMQGDTRCQSYVHLDGPRLDTDGFVVGEIELPGGLPPEDPETDLERE